MKSMLSHTINRLPKQEANTTKCDYFCMLLYLEDDNYSIEEVTKNVKTDDHIVSYAMIKHDQDYYLEETFDKKGVLLGHMGQKKKDHIHVVCALKSRSSISDIAHWMGVPQRFIQKCKNFDGSILYLTHRNAEDKHPYSPDEVITNIGDYCKYLYDRYEPTQSPLVSFYKYLEEDMYPTLYHFVQWYGVDRSIELTKYWQIIKSIMDEIKSHYKENQEQAQINHDRLKAENDTLKDLADKFGKVSVPCEWGDGSTYAQFTLNPENNELDLLGFTHDEEDKK